MAWTPPAHVTSGEASSAQYNAEVADNLQHLFDRIVYDDFSGTTDASGFLTVTHGVGTTPAFVQVQRKTPSTWDIERVDTIGATTFRVRALAHDGSVLASTAITGSFLCLKPA